MAYTSGKLTKNLVRTLGAGRHGDGNGLYLVLMRRECASQVEEMFLCAAHAQVLALMGYACQAL